MDTNLKRIAVAVLRSPVGIYEVFVNCQMLITQMYDSAHRAQHWSWRHALGVHFTPAVTYEQAATLIPSIPIDDLGLEFDHKGRAMKARIRNSHPQHGTVVEILGSRIVLDGVGWTPIRMPVDEEPTFVKTADLEVYE
jgi:hypothetical protein